MFTVSGEAGIHCNRCDFVAGTVGAAVDHLNAFHPGWKESGYADPVEHQRLQESVVVAAKALHSQASEHQIDGLKIEQRLSELYKTVDALLEFEDVE